MKKTLRPRAVDWARARQLWTAMLTLDELAKLVGATPWQLRTRARAEHWPRRGHSRPRVTPPAGPFTIRCVRCCATYQAARYEDATCEVCGARADAAAPDPLPRRLPLRPSTPEVLAHAAP